MSVFRFVRIPISEQKDPKLAGFKAPQFAILKVEKKGIVEALNRELEEIGCPPLVELYVPSDIRKDRDVMEFFESSKIRIRHYGCQIVESKIDFEMRHNTESYGPPVSHIEPGVRLVRIPIPVDEEEESNHFRSKPVIAILKVQWKGAVDILNRTLIEVGHPPFLLLFDPSDISKDSELVDFFDSCEVAMYDAACMAVDSVIDVELEKGGETNEDRMRRRSGDNSFNSCSSSAPVTPRAPPSQRILPQPRTSTSQEPKEEDVCEQMEDAVERARIQKEIEEDQKLLARIKKCPITALEELIRKVNESSRRKSSGAVNDTGSRKTSPVASMTISTSVIPPTSASASTDASNASVVSSTPGPEEELESSINDADNDITMTINDTINGGSQTRSSKGSPNRNGAPIHHSPTDIGNGFPFDRYSPQFQPHFQPAQAYAHPWEPYHGYYQPAMAPQSYVQYIPVVTEPPFISRVIDITEMHPSVGSSPITTVAQPRDTGKRIRPQAGSATLSSHAQGTTSTSQSTSATRNTQTTSRKSGSPTTPSLAWTAAEAAWTASAPSTPSPPLCAPSESSLAKKVNEKRRDEPQEMEPSKRARREAREDIHDSAQPDVSSKVASRDALRKQLFLNALRIKEEMESKTQELIRPTEPLLELPMDSHEDERVEAEPELKSCKTAVLASVSPPNPSIILKSVQTLIDQEATIPESASKPPPMDDGQLLSILMGPPVHVMSGRSLSSPEYSPDPSPTPSPKKVSSSDSSSSDSPPSSRPPALTIVPPSSIPSKRSSTHSTKRSSTSPPNSTLVSLLNQSPKQPTAHIISNGSGVMNSQPPTLERNTTISFHPPTSILRNRSKYPIPPPPPTLHEYWTNNDDMVMSIDEEVEAGSSTESSSSTPTSIHQQSASPSISIPLDDSSTLSNSNGFSSSPSPTLEEFSINDGDNDDIMMSIDAVLRSGKPVTPPPPPPLEVENVYSDFPHLSASLDEPVRSFTPPVHHFSAFLELPRSILRNATKASPRRIEEPVGECIGYPIKPRRRVVYETRIGTDGKPFVLPHYKKTPEKVAVPGEYESAEEMYYRLKAEQDAERMFKKPYLPVTRTSVFTERARPAARTAPVPELSPEPEAPDSSTSSPSPAPSTSSSSMASSTSSSSLKRKLSTSDDEDEVDGVPAASNGKSASNAQLRGILKMPGSKKKEALLIDMPSETPTHTRCNLCNKWFLKDHKQKIRYHVLHHCPMKAYQCRFCNYSHHELGKIKRHQQNVHKRLDADDEVLHYENIMISAAYDVYMKRCFPDYDTGKLTIGRVINYPNQVEDLHECMVCKKNVFKSQCPYHVVDKHVATKVYNCTKCKYKSIFKRELSIHVQAVHLSDSTMDILSNKIDFTDSTKFVLKSFFPTMIDVNDPDSEPELVRVANVQKKWFNKNVEMKELMALQDGLEHTLDQPTTKDAKCRVCNVTGNTPPFKTVYDMVLHAKSHVDDMDRQWKCPELGCPFTSNCKFDCDVHVMQRHEKNTYSPINRWHQLLPQFMKMFAKCFPPVAYLLPKSVLRYDERAMPENVLRINEELTNDTEVQDISMKREEEIDDISVDYDQSSFDDISMKAELL